MTKNIILPGCFAIFFCATMACAQNTKQVTGQVLCAHEPVAGANVWLEDEQGQTLNATASDVEGHFDISLPSTGVVVFHISALGYIPTQKIIHTDTLDKTDMGIWLLEPDAIGLQEVVVTGALRETYAADSPVRVQVISRHFLERNGAPANLIESVKMINGLQEVVACGVCNTNSISINGLPGAYTAVLIDGAPLYGHLASVYGLNGIPRSIVERIEVVRGPGATLFGSEAMAGVINVITKDPKKYKGLRAELSGSSNGEGNLSLVASPALKKSHAYIGVDGALLHRFMDANGEGFGDMALYDRWSAFGKWTVNGWKIYGKTYWENRRNGTASFVSAYPQYTGSPVVYGEAIRTRRLEFFGQWKGKEASPWQFDFSLSRHFQDSYYGADHYRAIQHLFQGQLTWRRHYRQHQWLAGWSNRILHYDDNTVATPQGPDRQFVPGIFAQDEWAVSKKINALFGARLDYYRAHGLITSPRLNLKIKAGDWTTCRLNYGTGFRIVNLFAEDHAFVSGQREVIIAETLRPERSWNLSADINHVLAIGKGQGSVDIEVFYVYFNNKIIPDYSQPGFIRYANTRGHAMSRGVSARWSYQWQRPLNVNLGINVQKVTQTEPTDNGQWETRPVLFANQWSINGAANYTFKKQGFTLAYTTQINGPMRLPLIYDLDATGQPLPYSRPLYSAIFGLHHLQCTKNFEKAHLEVFAGIRNIGAYRQAYSPLSGWNDPAAAPGFSAAFDTSYAYGPMQGRVFYIGLRTCIE